MAELLTTAGVSDRLEKIIKEANGQLILISPFIRVNRRVRELIQEQDRRKIDVRFVYGKRDVDPSEKKWLDSVSSVRTSFYADLHAKFYLNENAALLTSMNLYESSQVKNYEIGLYISKTEDPELYESILNEAKYLFTNSDPPLKDTSTKSAGRNPATQDDGRGFCIKCANNIPFKPKPVDGDEQRPFCDECHEKWEKRPESERSYRSPESYCHACGEICETHGDDHNSSYARPICTDCYPEMGPN